MTLLPFRWITEEPAVHVSRPRLDPQIGQTGRRYEGDRQPGAATGKGVPGFGPFLLPAGAVCFVPTL
jgi:hypothetical protein